MPAASIPRASSHHGQLRKGTDIIHKLVKPTSCPHSTLICTHIQNGFTTSTEEQRGLAASRRRGRHTSQSACKRPSQPHGSQKASILGQRWQTAVILKSHHPLPLVCCALCSKARLTEGIGGTGQGACSCPQSINELGLPGRVCFFVCARLKHHLLHHKPHRKGIQMSQHWHWKG